MRGSRIALVIGGATLVVAGVIRTGVLRAPAAAEQPGAAARADSLLRDLAARNLFQGAVVLMRGGTVLYEGGFGLADRERGVPFTPDTPMDGASMAKTATAAALLTLADEGRLDLDARVQTVLPEYPHRATLIRHLLTHAAGLPDFGWLDSRVPEGAVRTNASHLALIARDAPRPAFTPGTAFAYDNVAYDVAAMIVERVSGQRYDEFVAARFFRPLSVKAFLRPAMLADWPGVRTRGYQRTSQGVELLDGFDFEGFYGASNLAFSARDLARWAAGYGRVVPAAVLATARVPAALDDGRRTGISLASFYLSTDGRRRYYTGHHQGFYSVSFASEDGDLSLGWAANDAPPTWIQSGLTRALIAIGEGRPPEALVPPPQADTGIDPGGFYRVPGVGEVAVRRDGGGVRVSVAGVEYQGFEVQAGEYFLPGVDAAVSFHRAENGAIRLRWDAIIAGVQLARRESPGPVP